MDVEALLVFNYERSFYYFYFYGLGFICYHLHHVRQFTFLFYYRYVGDWAIV